MKAIIMAGGEGSRLRPLTCDCPKPMVRFLDKPILEYALLHLKAHGVTDVGITLGYLPTASKTLLAMANRWGFRCAITRSGSLLARRAA